MRTNVDFSNYKQTTTKRRIFRRMQLFCPTREPLISWIPEDYGVPPGRTEELWIETDDGEFLYAWYCRAENPIASALYFHGISSGACRSQQTQCVTSQNQSFLIRRQT